MRNWASDVAKLQSFDESLTQCVSDLSLFVIGRGVVAQRSYFDEVRRACRVFLQTSCVTV